MCEDDLIERVNSGLEAVGRIRVLPGSSTAYTYTNDLSLPAVKKAAHVASKAAAMGIKGNSY